MPTAACPLDRKFFSLQNRAIRKTPLPCVHPPHAPWLPDSPVLCPAGLLARWSRYTLRLFGGRHPLCGIGVTSLIVFTSRPAAARARIADSRPDPGPFTRTSTERMPWSRAWLAALLAACCAANGVPLRDPRKPSEPELFHASVLPSLSVMVTMVLLKDAWMNATPCGTFLRSFFLKTFFLPFVPVAPLPGAAAAAFAILFFLRVAAGASASLDSY